MQSYERINICGHKRIYLELQLLFMLKVAVKRMKK